MPIERKLIANPPPWPNGARCAVAFTFDMDADSILHLAHHQNANNRVVGDVHAAVRAAGGRAAHR